MGNTSSQLCNGTPGRPQHSDVQNRAKKSSDCPRRNPAVNANVSPIFGEGRGKCGNDRKKRQSNQRQHQQDGASNNIINREGEEKEILTCFPGDVSVVDHDGILGRTDLNQTAQKAMTHSREKTAKRSRRRKRDIETAGFAKSDWMEREENKWKWEDRMSTPVLDPIRPTFTRPTAPSSPPKTKSSHYPIPTSSVIASIGPELLPPSQQSRSAVRSAVRQRQTSCKVRKSASCINQDHLRTDMGKQERYVIGDYKKEQRRKHQPHTPSANPSHHPLEAAEPTSKKRKITSELESINESKTYSMSRMYEQFPLSGSYTKQEVQKLTRAIEAYCEDNDVSHVQVNEIIQASVLSHVHGKSCKAFWDEICPCLPNRWSRESIIKFVRRKWHNFDKRGRWDAQEEQRLRQAYAKMPGQWTKIGGFIGRLPDDCRDRWRNYLSCSDTMVRNTWQDSEVNELLNVVQACLNTLLERLSDVERSYWRRELQCTEQREVWRPASIRNLVRKMPACMDVLRSAFEDKYQRVSKKASVTERSATINWDLISKNMGKKRSRLQIMAKWKALEHTYSQDPQENFFTEANHWRIANGQKWAQQMLPGDKYNIVRAMMNLGLTNEERVVWHRVAHHDLVKLKWAHQAKMTFLSMKELVSPQESLPQLLSSLKSYFEMHHSCELNTHWCIKSGSGKGAPQVHSSSSGPLGWRGHVRGELSYKSSARVTDGEEDKQGN